MIIQKQNGWGHAHGSGWWLLVVQRAQLELAGHSWQVRGGDTQLPSPLNLFPFALRILPRKYGNPGTTPFYACIQTDNRVKNQSKRPSLSPPNPPAAFLLLPILPSPSCFIPEVRPSFMATEDAGLASWNLPFGYLVEDY